MGQSPSSCLGSSRAVVDQAHTAATLQSYKAKAMKGEHDSNENENSVQIRGSDDIPSQDDNASPTQSDVPTISVNTDGPPTPDPCVHPPPASAVPPTQPVFGGISRQSAKTSGQKKASSSIVGRLLPRGKLRIGGNGAVDGECSHRRVAAQKKTRQRPLHFRCRGSSASSGDISHTESMPLDQRNDVDVSNNDIVGGGGGILNFLLATSEDEESIPTVPSDVPNLADRQEGRPSSPIRRVFSPRASSRRGRSAAKSPPVSLMPTKTQLFYRDPLVLERYGLDVADETTVAGTQIYAARVAAAKVDVTLECGCENMGTSASSDNDAGSSAMSPPDRCDEEVRGSPASPHSSESQDETCSLLLLPASANSAHPSSLLSKKGIKHRRFRLFGQSKQRSMKPNDFICDCSFYGSGFSVHASSLCQNHCDNRYSESQIFPHKIGTPPHVGRYRETNIPSYPKGCASFLFTREAVRNNTADPVPDIVCISEKYRIYVADIGLTAMDCSAIIGVAEQCSRGNWSAYTYAKQTLGCREHDDLASVCVGPVMTATATIMEELEEPYVEEDELEDEKNDSGTRNEDDAKNISDDGEENDDATAMSEIPPMQERRPDSAPQTRPRYKRQLVLDDREPHLVKYDLSRKERQKLDIHTDKSEWTFLISLSEGCGAEYRGGGTYFECIDSTVHLSRGQALIFPGKLRHRGQKITAGRRFLLVGFLVDKNEDARKAAVTPSRKTVSSPKFSQTTLPLASS